MTKPNATKALMDVAQAMFDWEESVLAAETHSSLSDLDLNEIKDFRRKLLRKSRAQTEALIFEWTKTGVLTRRQHVLLCRYHYQGGPNLNDE
jgi:hypothetical protein